MRSLVKLRLCPKCKNPTLRNAFNVSGWLAPNMYECKCGYVGRFYIEVDSEELEEFQEKQGEKVDEKSPNEKE